MLLLAIAALSAAAPAEPDWRAFDWRQRGVDVAPAHYDAARIERRGGRIRVWLRSRLLLSGLPDIEDETRVEIDCASRSIRIIEADITAETLADYGQRPGRRHGRQVVRAAPVPIEEGSTHDALARELCMER